MPLLSAGYRSAEQQRGWDGEAKRLCASQVDEQVELGRLLDGKIRRPCTFKGCWIIERRRTRCHDEIRARISSGRRKSSRNIAAVGACMRYRRLARVTLLAASLLLGPTGVQATPTDEV